MGNGFVKARVSPKKFMPKKPTRNDIGMNITVTIVERFHDVVGAVRDHREVSLDRAADQVAQAFGDIVNPHDVIVKIAKIHAMLGLDRLIRIAGQPVQHLALGRKGLVQHESRPLDPEDGPKRFRARVLDHRVLDLVDLVVKILDRQERLIDRQLEEPVQKMVRAVAQAIARVALDARRDPDRGSPGLRCGT